METRSIEDTVIPVNAEVRCTDGICGHSTCLLVNPVTNKVTHFVIKGAAAPHTEFIVPIGSLVEASTDLIQLRCSRAELAHMDAFAKTEFVEEKASAVFPAGYGNSAFGSGTGSFLYWPFVLPAAAGYTEEHQQIPPGELVIRRGTRIEATDGTVGHVDEYLVHPDTGNITHLVMREGHPWGQKDVSIPVSAICKTEDDTVVLNVSKHEIEALPSIPIHRPWFNK